MNDAETEKAVVLALRAGYRLIDTAENYGNETGVGRGIKSSGIDRGEVFVTSKFNAKWHGVDEVQQIFEQCARRLGVDYIDLFLIHWPNPAKDRYVDAFRGMIKLLEAGKVRALGVSNFKPAHLDRLIAETGVTPHLNQVQLNPRVIRESERAYHASHRIITETWSPLGRGGDLLKEAPIVQAAQRLGKTPGQVILRWQIQLGLIPVPKSSNQGRLAQNLDVFSFELTDAEMGAISGLDRGGGADSDRMGH